MILYQTARGVIAADTDTDHRRLSIDWDELLRSNDLRARLAELLPAGEPVTDFELDQAQLPLRSQEVWAAGVTYFRSRDARMAESEQAGGDSFYDRVYTAPRPELFFKANARTAVGPGQDIAIRSDAEWNVPEPELVLLANPSGQLVGYTVGNDVSSRDIEGENPLYLPQAKVYDRSCALGPGVLVADQPLPPSTEIVLQITRAGADAFAGATTLAELKRTPDELLEYLYRDNSFPDGCFLMTGTGIVPPDGFTLQRGDIVAITIAGIGTLTNRVG